MLKLPRRQFLHLAAGAAALPAVSRVARAQAYPTRPIRLVIPFPPGGGFDAVGRPWAEKIKPLQAWLKDRLTLPLAGFTGGKPTACDVCVLLL